MDVRETVGHPFRILAPGDAAAAAEPTDLVLEGSAFGGGTHPTTASCLEVLAALVPWDGLYLLDLGSGTGILAIAALRLGAARALCVDVNPEAVASARRNGIANGVGDRLDHRCGTADDLDGERFHVVVANIGGELLLDHAALVVRLVRPGGRLLLSGLLRGYADELERAYAGLGCRALSRRFPAEFCTLLLGSSPRPPERPGHGARRARPAGRGPVERARVPPSLARASRLPRLDVSGRGRQPWSTSET